MINISVSRFQRIEPWILSSKYLFAHYSTIKTADEHMSYLSPNLVFNLLRSKKEAIVDLFS